MRSITSTEFSEPPDSEVYLLRSYQVDIGAHWQYLADKLKARIPGHRPLWTALSVPPLAFPAMSVELEVEAIKKE
ncbi:hypothetical protein RHOSPDRAFT_37326 [Rhodotorula sp. JG-1b]|nr:hypothetical protein RHOSPDRAFT_37326 [Rhodotorula sp. JG-1b]